MYVFLFFLLVKTTAKHFYVSVLETLREAGKKVLLLMAIKRGVKGRAIKQKIIFFNISFQRSKISTAIKLFGGEGG